MYGSGMDQPQSFEQDTNKSNKQDANHSLDQDANHAYDQDAKMSNNQGDNHSLDQDANHSYGQGANHSLDQGANHSYDQDAKMSNNQDANQSYDQERINANDEETTKSNDDQAALLNVQAVHNDEDLMIPSNAKFHHHDSTPGFQSIIGVEKQPNDTDDDIKTLIQYLDQDKYDASTNNKGNSNEITSPGQEPNQEPSVASREDKAIATKILATEKFNIANEIKVTENLNMTLFDENEMYQMNQMNVMNDFYDEFGESEVSESNITEIFLSSGCKKDNTNHFVMALFILWTYFNLYRQ